MFGRGLIVWVCSFLSPGIFAQVEKAPETQASGRKLENGKDLAEKEAAKRLVMELEDVLLRTESAHLRVRRVQAVIEEIQKLSQSGSAESDKALVATEEMVLLLKQSMDQLYREAVLVRDRVRNDVIPEYNATTAKMKARLEVLKSSDPRYKEMQEIVDRAVENQSKIKDQVSRLDGNISLLGETRADLLDKLSIFSLWKEVNLKGSELIDKLSEFNGKLEEIYRKLNPDPS